MTLGYTDMATRTVVKRVVADLVLSDTTLLPIPEFVFPLAASQSVSGIMSLFVLGDAGADFKITFSGPAGAVVLYALLGPRAADTVVATSIHATAWDTELTARGTDATGSLTLVSFSFANSTTAGDVTAKFAQNVDTAFTCTLKIGSWLTGSFVG